MAIFKGLRKGFIAAVCSFVGLIIAVAAAIKLSATVANYLGEKTNIAYHWLPVIAFLLVFIGIMLLVNIGIKALETLWAAMLMGWLNKILGAVLYCIIHTIFFILVVFYFQHLEIIKPEKLNSSLMMPVVLHWGPLLIDFLGRIIPFVSEAFEDLKRFFGTLNELPRNES